MPSLSELPGDLKRPKFIKSLDRLGFEISMRGGNGTHYKVTWPSTQKAFSVPMRLDKHTLYYLIKEIEVITNGHIAWDDIKNNL